MSEREDIHGGGFGISAVFTFSNNTEGGQATGHWIPVSREMLIDAGRILDPTTRQSRLWPAELVLFPRLHRLTTRAAHWRREAPARVRAALEVLRHGEEPDLDPWGNEW